MRQYAADISPFETRQTDEPWLLWKAGAPLTSLCEAERTAIHDESLATYPDEAPTEQAPAPLNIPGIRRPQYQAVLSRMRQASMRTGTYAAWST